ncbi:MAG: serine hydrolase domain-containing protein [Cytophagaceae bacterium]
MKRRIWLRRILFGFLGIVVLGNILIVVTGKTFIYKAMYYNLADIDDYKIFPQRIISKSSKPQEWPNASSYNKFKLSDTLRHTFDSLGTIAFLIIRNDSVYYEEYWDGYGKDSYSNSFSVAKSFVGTMAGIALQEGKIKSLDQPVGDFLPEYREGDKGKITIRHLLMMSGGLNWDETYASAFSVTTEAYYGTDLKKLMYRLKAAEEPGKIFDYKSGDTQLLGLVLEKATGKKLAQYAAEKLWQPMGCVHSAIWSLDHKDGDEKAFCCINSNARDFARLGNLYLHGGNWKGTQVLDSNYLKQALTPNGLSNRDGQKVDYYGYHIWLIPDYNGQRYYYFRGILGQYVIMMPDKNAVIVRLGKKRGQRVFPHFKEVYQMIDEAEGMLK